MLGADNAASWSWLFLYCLSPLLDETVGISSAQEIPIRTAPSFAASIPWDSLQPPACSRFLNFQIQLAAAYVNRAFTQRIAFEFVFNYQLAVVRSLREVPRFTPWEPIQLAQHPSDSESDVEVVEDRQAFHWAAPFAYTLLAAARRHLDTAREIEQEARALLRSAQGQAETFSRFRSQQISAALERQRSRSRSPNSSRAFSDSPPGGRRRDKH